MLECRKGYGSPLDVLVIVRFQPNLNVFRKFMKTAIKVKKKKQFHYRPGQALRVPGGWGSQISRQSAHEGGKVISPTHRPPLPLRKYSWYSFLLEAESTPRDTVRPEWLYQWKIPMTPSGIEPATFWLVAQCFNQLRHRVTPSGIEPATFRLAAQCLNQLRYGVPYKNCDTKHQRKSYGWFLSPRACTDKHTLWAHF